MSPKVKRIVNAFVLGTAGTLLLLAVQNWADIQNAVQVGDWASLGTLGISLLGGAILAGLRALQAFIPVVPSPEPEENPTGGVSK